MSDGASDVEAVLTTPVPDPGPFPDLPEPLNERVKRRLLGEPLEGDAADEPELDNPTALAVYSSDCISSSAYATEEILHVLVPVVGVFAFSLVVPITVAILVMLTLLILSYRQTIRTYPYAGGAYLVSRENFGYRAALVAGLSLLIGYILTVAVSASAGVAALTSVVPALRPWSVPVTLAVVVLVAGLNLRGAKESGRIFMVPTYLFIGVMGLMIVVGMARLVAGGGLEHVGVEPGMVGDLMAMPQGTDGIAEALGYGAGLWVVMGAFATGSSALTGVEAISNGVETFRRPRWLNAQRTLVAMGVILAALFLGLSLLAGRVHATPFESGSPTVISQVGRVVFGDDAIGHVLYLIFQVATLLVLFLGANTSFAGFPRLAGFAASDAYLPRQLMKRGHRLVYSNGILLLAGTAMVLIVVSGARVNALIPFYGIGVFTSFTMSQAGMARHHLRTREKRWKRGLAINGAGAVATFVVAAVFLVKFFSDGVWVLLGVVPLVMIVLMRMNRQYTEERTELSEEVAELAGRRILPGLVVLVMVGDLNRATAAALRYGRSLQPSEIRAVHLAADAIRAEELTAEWTALGLGGIPLQIVDCPDRRIANGAMKVAAAEVRKGDREVTVLLPQIGYRRLWHRILHDRTAAAIAQAVQGVPRVNVTFVPYLLRAGRSRSRASVADVIEHDTTERKVQARPDRAGRTGSAHQQEAPTVTGHDSESAAPPSEGGHDIGSVTFRDRVVLEGRIQSIRVQPWSGVATLEVDLVDATGSIAVVFLGRRRIAGLAPGVRLQVRGVVGSHAGRLAMLNPRYRILV